LQMLIAQCGESVPGLVNPKSFRRELCRSEVSAAQVFWACSWLPECSRSVWTPSIKNHGSARSEKKGRSYPFAKPFPLVSDWPEREPGPTLVHRPLPFQRFSISSSFWSTLTLKSPR
jgi:hypothetical protein